MANIFLAWNNQTDSGTLSGGSWLAALPLANLQNRVIQKVARSSDATVASTQFQIDLGAAQTIGVVGLVYHNISVGGYARVTGAESAASFTNLLTAGRDYTNAAWSKTNITVTANNTTAPDGTTTATRIAPAITGVTTLGQSIVATGTTATVTMFIRKGSGATDGNSFAIRNVTTATNLIWVTVNYDTGAITYIAGTTGASMVAEGDGWWKLTLSVTTGITVGNTLLTYAGFVGGSENASEFFYIWESWLAAANPLLFDSLWGTVWPSGVVPQLSLDWEADNFWLGTLTTAQRASFQSPYIVKSSSPPIARYWRVEISDTLNPNGYVQIGRLFMARGWQPTINYSYGASLGYVDTTPVDVSLSGAEYFDIRPKYRSWNLGFNYIGQTDAYQYILDMQRVAGVSGEVLVMPDGGEDASLQPTISFVGRLKQLGSVKQDQPSAYNINFEIKELL